MSSPVLGQPTEAGLDVLIQRFTSRTANVVVVGCGYVGLPLIGCFVRAGYHVTGLDNDKAKLDKISGGCGMGTDVSDKEMVELLNTGRLSFSVDGAVVQNADAAIICVPTPLNKNRAPDLGCIKASMKTVINNSRKPLLCVLESTTYPGCTREVVVQAYLDEGWKVGEEVFICFSPERVDPVNPKWNTQNTPKVIGGVTPACLQAGMTLYERVIDKMVPVGSPEEAELTKLYENTFRTVNCALVNELTQMASRLGINMWNVIEAAKTKPFGFMAFYPGPGVGGHCLPKDPLYLSHTAKTEHFYPRFVELASDVNENMPAFNVMQISRALNLQKKCAYGARVLVLGIAYKKNINDTRDSPALDLIKLCSEEGMQVDYYDTYVPSYTFHEHVICGEENVHMTSVHALDAETIASYDLCVIACDHDNIDWQCVLDNAVQVFDTRNAVANRGLLEKYSHKVVRLGDPLEPVKAGKIRSPLVSPIQAHVLVSVKHAAARALDQANQTQAELSPRSQQAVQEELQRGEPLLVVA